MVPDDASPRRARTSTFTGGEGVPFALKQKLIYGAPMFSLTSLTLLLALHAPLFYDGLGADLSAFAFYTALGRSFDTLTDPVMAWLTDRTRSKYGRRRPFMAAACIPYGIFFTLIFSPPESLSAGGLAAWYGFFYWAFYMMDTVANISWTALGPELTDDYTERNSLYFWSNIFKLMGTMIGVAGPAVVLKVLQTGECFHCMEPGAAHVSAAANQTEAFCFTKCEYFCADSTHEVASLWASQTSCQAAESTCLGCHTVDKRTTFSMVAGFFGAWYAVAMLICVASFREKDSSLAQTPVPLVPAMMRTFRNPPFRMMLAAWALDFTFTALLTTMLPFYVQFVLWPEKADPLPEVTWQQNTSTVLALLGATMLMMTVLSMPGWLHLTTKIGKRNAWIVFSVSLMPLVLPLSLLNVGAIMPALVLFALLGIPLGGQFLNESILADIIDYEELLTGKRTEGSFTVFQTFIPKLAALPAQTLPLAFIKNFGFVASVNGKVQDQPPSVRRYVLGVFVFIPFLLMALGLWIKLKFPIKTKEQLDAILAAVQQLKLGKSAVDPITNKVVKWPEYSEDVEKAAWQLDHFSGELVKTFLARRATGLSQAEALVPIKSRMTQVTAMSVFSLALFAALIPVAYPLVSDSTWSFVPSIVMLSFGLSLTAVLFNALRLSCAKALELEDMPLNVIEEYVARLDSSESAADTEMARGI